VQLPPFLIQQALPLTLLAVERILRVPQLRMVLVPFHQFSLDVRVRNAVVTGPGGRNWNITMGRRHSSSSRRCSSGRRCSSSSRLWFRVRDRFPQWHLTLLEDSSRLDAVDQNQPPYIGKKGGKHRGKMNFAPQLEETDGRDDLKIERSKVVPKSFLTRYSHAQPAPNTHHTRFSDAAHTFPVCPLCLARSFLKRTTLVPDLFPTRYTHARQSLLTRCGVCRRSTRGPCPFHSHAAHTQSRSSVCDRTIRHLYKSFVRPHLEYAAPVWCPYKHSQIDALENVQRRATRCIPSLKGLSYEERLRKLDLPTLLYRRARGDMIETYKMFNSYDTDVCLRFSMNDNPTRDHSLKLCKIRAQKDIRKHSFTLRITDLWNSLPQSVIDSDNLQTFKNRLDKFWTRHEFKFNYKASPTSQC